MKKKVSILVPVYNVELSLDKCIQSILSQTYKNFELILVDDCSIDNSLSICYDYAKKDERIKVIKKETHTCLSDVRNIGLENATGEYIMFTDSDDYVCETFVEEMVNAIETKNVDVVRCKANRYLKDGTSRIENLRGYEDKILKKSDFKEYIPHLITTEDNIACYSWALIIKRDVINIRFNPTSYCLQDVVFIVELLLKSASSIYFLDRPLYEYCYNAKGTTFNGKVFFLYTEGLINTAKRIKTILKEQNLLTPELEQSFNYSILEACFGKIQTIKNNSIFNIYKSIKQIFKNKELQKIAENSNKSNLSPKKKARYYLIKMHLHFLLALYEKSKR